MIDRCCINHYCRNDYNYLNNCNSGDDYVGGCDDDDDDDSSNKGRGDDHYKNSDD